MSSVFRFQWHRALKAEIVSEKYPRVDLHWTGVPPDQWQEGVQEAASQPSRLKRHLEKIQLNITKAFLIIKTCVSLHTFLRNSKTSRRLYTPPNSVDKYSNGELTHPESWRQNNTGTSHPLQPILRRAPVFVVEISLNFMRYMYSREQLLLTKVPYKPEINEIKQEILSSLTFYSEFRWLVDS